MVTGQPEAAHRTSGRALLYPLGLPMSRADGPLLLIVVLRGFLPPALLRRLWETVGGGAVPWGPWLL